MDLSNIDIPSAWKKLDLDSMTGILLVIGAPSVGKTSFARYLFHSLTSIGRKCAYLDGDPGQSELGPPTTMTAAFHPEAVGDKENTGQVWRYFVGSITPSGHMLPVLVGAERLSDVVRKEGADCVIFDTSGLVDPTKGGAALKFAKINLLQPNYVVAIRAEQELEYLLRPLRRSSQAKLIELSSSPAARARSPEQRREHRARQYAEYFKGSKSNIISWPDYAVFPAPHFALNRIVALEDAAGLVIDLGIILKIERQKHEVEIFTPIDSVEKIDGLRIGDVKVDPRTFQDQLIR